MSPVPDDTPTRPNHPHATPSDAGPGCDSRPVDRAAHTAADVLEQGTEGAPRTPYHPIDCGLHDELQLLVMRGRTVEVRVAGGPDGDDRTVTDTLADVYSKDGAEWLRLGSGETVRLDRLVEVDGRAFLGDD